MKRNACRSLALIAILYAFVVPQTRGQANTYLDETGVPSFTTAMPVELGFVNLANGNMHLEIPIVSYPQRGRQQITARMVYDSHIWRNDPNNGWQHTGGWRFISGADQGSVSYTTNDTPPRCLIYPNYFYTTKYQGYFWQEPNGTYHKFRITLTYNGACPQNNISSGADYAIDNSGYYMTVSNYTSITVFAKDGTQVYPTVEDTNGNYFSIDSNGNMVDTLQRTPITFSGSTLNCSPSCQVTLSYLNSQATRSTVALNYTNGAIAYPPPCTGSPGAAQTQLQSIVLPNGTSYSFTYNDGCGELTGMTLPTGGQVTYTYANFTDMFNNIGRWITSRTVNGNTWLFPPSSPSCDSTLTLCQQLVTVTSPLGDDSVYTFSDDRSTYWFSQMQLYKGSSTSGGTLLFTHTSDINSIENSCPYGTTSCGLKIRDTDIWPVSGGTLQKKKEYNYDSPNTANITAVKEWNYYSNGAFPTTPDRETDTTYVTSTNYTYLNITNLPSTVQIKDASGTVVAQTSYSYDQTSLSPTTAPQHASMTAYRGNPTTISRWLNTNSSWISTALAYDDAGNVISRTDPKQNTTTYSYADSWSGSGCVAATTFAYVTKTTDALTHRTQDTYYPCTGLLQSTQDENDIQGGRSGKTFSYDGSNRRIQENYPDGGQTTWTFNDPTLPQTVTTTSKITSALNLITKSVSDGYGRVTQTQLTSDPDGTIYTATTYDPLGRVGTVYNPTRCNPPTTNCGESTWGFTSYSYDALGRTTQVTNPNATTVLTSYTGRATQVQDEGNGGGRVTRISQTDGLGRLTSVCEVSGASLIGSGGTPGACGQDIAGTGFLTSYEYNALDNLTSVSMSGLNPRTFAFDSLSRLTSANNPESGQICYGTVSGGACQTNGYDANGNLVTKTDARGITMSFSYDALNRLTGKTYSDGTPAATFNYDQPSALGVTLSNTIGRKSSQSTAGPNATGSVFGYDAMGRISNNSQCTPQNCGTGVFAFQYTQYDFVGDLISATNATGVTFTYAYNTVARLTGITSNFVDSSHPGTLFSNAHYSPFGSLTGAALGNGVTESWSYNNRGWQQSGTATFGSTTPYSFSVATFAPNGDILAANDSVNGNWVYKFDDFDRLVCSNLASNGTCATPTSGTPTYTYDHDRFGNRWHQNGPQSSQLSFDANNRIMGVTGVGYDLGGNLTSDGSGPGAHRYFYDAENRIIQLDGTLGSCSTATACYVYNADGQRVRKTTGGSSMDYLYDLAGHKVADVDPTGVFMQGELYAGDRHFAIFAPAPGPTGATFFTHSDWLGTERARTDMTGTNCESITSLPYGDGQSITGTCGDVSPMHFTGKERDSESGNDDFGARYYSSSTGRWLSPDILNLTSARLVNPSNTLNKYAYGADNPLKYIDRDGEDITIFYRPPSGTFNMDFGHIFIGVVNQNTQQAGFLDFYPTGSVDSAGKGPGAINKGNMQDRAAQAQAGQFATLTIRTTPEAAQKVLNLITALQKGDAPGYAALSKNCTTICEDVLHDLGLDFGDILPQSYFLDAVSKFNPQALYRYTVRDVPVLPMAGIEYGNPRNVGMNYNSWLFQLFLNQFQNQQSRPPQNPAPPKPAAKCPLCPL
jgi:RHS repeat-associated protein